MIEKTKRQLCNRFLVKIYTFDNASEIFLFVILEDVYLSICVKKLCKIDQGEGQIQYSQPSKRFRHLAEI